MLTVDSAPINNKYNNENNYDRLLYRRLKQYQPTETSDYLLFDDSFSAMSNVERRNVIWPRICYFARVTGSGVHQKLCLPYGDERRRRRRRSASVRQQTTH